MGGAADRTHAAGRKKQITSGIAGGVNFSTVNHPLIFKKSLMQRRIQAAFAHCAFEILHGEARFF